MKFLNDFIDYLWKYSDKENGAFRKDIKWKTDDKVVDKEEQKDIADRIKEIFELWKQEFGKPIVVQEESNGK